MALHDVEPATKTLVGDLEAAAEFEAGLVKLMPFCAALPSHYRAGSASRGLGEGIAVSASVYEGLQSQGLALYDPSQRILFPNSVALGGRALGMKRWWIWLGLKNSNGIELSDTARAMHGLTDARREALILVGVSSFSYEEAATHKGCYRPDKEPGWTRPPLA
jgi:hypothetical protein